MKLLVERQSDDAKAVGLTRERLMLAAESRLRAARLYTDSFDVSNGVFLYVNVTVTGAAYGMRVEYTKIVFDSASGESRSAATWTIGAVGAHGQDASFIVQNLSEGLDRFLAAYLRVNELACGGR